MHFIKFDRFYFWGPIIRDILENIENLRSKNDKGKKVKIYSGVIFKKSNKFQYLKSSAFFSMIQLLYRFFHFSVLIMFISHHLQVLSSLTFISKVSSHVLSFSPLISPFEFRWQYLSSSIEIFKYDKWWNGSYCSTSR